MRRDVSKWFVAPRWMLMGLVGVGLCVGTAFAQSKYDKRLRKLRSQVETLESNEHSQAVSGDIDKLKQILDDAKSLLGQGDIEEANWRMTRASEMIELVEQRLKLADMKQKAENREETYQRYTEETIPMLKEEIAKLKKQHEELKQRLDDQS